MPGRIDKNWIDRLLHLGLPASDAANIPDPGQFTAIGFVGHSEDGRPGRPPTEIDVLCVLQLMEEEGLSLRQIRLRTVIWNGRTGRWDHPSLGTLRRKLKEYALETGRGQPSAEKESA